MGPKTWSVILTIVEAAIDECVTYIKDKLKGGKHDSTGTGKTK
jgi:hypothetical protein